MNRGSPPKTGYGRGAVATEVVEGRPPTAGQRLAYLDNLKTMLIAGIIAAHAIMGYSEFGSWTYQDVRESTISWPMEMALIVPVAVGSLFLMGLFFLVAGLLTHDALARKGPRRFASDRLLRLGVPFAFYTLLLWPVLEFVLLEPFLYRGSYWWWFTTQDPPLDPGPMWFVGVLLIYSLGYAAWVRLRGGVEGSAEALPSRTLVLLMVAVGMATFVVRLVFPIASEQAVGLHLWQWPQCLAAFGLGVVAGKRGWLRPVTDGLYRRCGVASLGMALTMSLMILSGVLLGLEEEVFYGGWGLFAVLTAVLEGVLAITVPVWALGFGQRHLNRSGRLRRAAARGSYAAFMLQGPVLVGLALLLRRPTCPPTSRRSWWPGSASPDRSRSPGRS